MSAAFITWQDHVTITQEHHKQINLVPQMLHRLDMAMEGFSLAMEDVQQGRSIGQGARFWMRQADLHTGVFNGMYFESSDDGETTSSEKGFLARSWDRVCEFFSKIWKAITDFFKSKTMSKEVLEKKTAHLRQRLKRVKDGGKRAVKDGDVIQVAPVSAWWSNYSVIDETLIEKSLEHMNKVDAAVRGLTKGMEHADSALSIKLADLVKAGDVKEARKIFYSISDEEIRRAINSHTQSVTAEALKHNDIASSVSSLGGKPGAEGSRLLEMANHSAGLYFVNLEQVAEPILVPVFVKNISGADKNGAVHAIKLDNVERMLDLMDTLIETIDKTQNEFLVKAVEDSQQVSDKLMEAVTDALKTGNDANKVANTVRYMAKYISSYAASCNKIMIAQRHTWDMAGAYINKSLE